MKRKILNTLKLSFPSRSANEALARSIAAAFVSQLDPTMEELCDVKTAVSEAVTNAVVHAYPDRVGTIEMTLRLLEGGEIDISVRDKGRGIENIDLARTPTYTTGGADRSGMGFTIMESFMGYLRVLSTPGRGTSVRMRKKLGHE
ncbi:MAG: anti-sigma F factor [Clostridia bacterium]|nr:anti-sigma F factor [Clostridia bacterium]MBQ4623849.1 anti-sigma F factor [Clostridia bacterium]MBR6762694.1 anti-sigma F factor [Clostridia bacterium]